MTTPTPHESRELRGEPEARETSELLAAEPALATYDQAKALIPKLTKREREVLLSVAFPMPRPFIQGNNAALRKLHALGLIEEFEDEIQFIGSIMMTVRGWQLPLGYPAHIALCEWCAATNDDADAARQAREGG